MRPFVHYSPVRIVFANGALNDLPQYLDGARGAVVVTGKSSARKAGLIDRVNKILHDGGVEKVEFADAGSNPTISEVDAIARTARDIDAECMVGIGGGSAMDAAKAAAVVATNGGAY